ncbi:spore germination protein [Bacillus sp. BRMEA1]|uniref:spore germination protein n=1 Tax=Neobacillus endophyticus TaxID=2738405 RepID=UPI001565B9EF|nr:spore germination protein [Neobacillus endophyticus]NRD76999.1 spore germination protein [Neobacillus endophyticus]
MMKTFRKIKPLKKAIQELERSSELPPNVQDGVLHTSLTENEQALKQIFENCSDIVFRTIIINEQAKMLLVYVDGLVEMKTLDQVLIKPMMFEGMPNGLKDAGSVGKIVQDRLIAFSKVDAYSTIHEVIQGILKANLAVLVEGESQALLADIKGFEKRSIEEPSAELVVRGPRDGFTETLRVNTNLVRRRIRSPRLKMESASIGDLSQTDVVIAYIEGIVQDPVLEEVRQRVLRIQIDGVLESAFIEEFIEDMPFSPFPQIQNTERPDVVCASLLEGKVAIFVDNTPFVLIAPMTFWTGVLAAEDYYERALYTTFIRWIRFVLINISLFLPSLYVAITTYHPQLIPTSLLISVAAAREGIPFPAVVEALMMEFLFEGLREAGVRLPKPIGSAVSIVGALVIGQAAVEAGIISAPMVIIVATTGIASFSFPRYNLGTAYRMLRFPMLFLAGMLGLYGVACGALAIIIHLTNIRSFGIPYLSPIAPQIPRGLKDVLIRSPRWNMTHRPKLIVGEEKERIPEGQQPGPRKGGLNE